ncbi:2' O-ribose methyltransferase [Knufia fluminis]|uniref:rRNA methyltransferase 2, mitochondrial n=1 Tax=Knufia fluminis TaxID=191047 RepID=A0AAN8I3X0_9EURO|nr:2' O-ribose methyltransferase [Knufia fluminis]
MPIRASSAWRTSLPCRIVALEHHPSFLPLQCRPYTVSTSSQHGSTSSSQPSNTSSYPSAPQRNNLKPRFGRLRPTSLSTSPSTFSSKDARISSSQLNLRHASSNTRWLTRQKTDRFATEAKVQNLKSRAAFKLLQINDRFRILKPGNTVVDLGFAPGSWSQVAIELVGIGVGRVVGVDVIPVRPPRGVSGIQGDFLSEETRERVVGLLRDVDGGRVRRGAMGTGMVGGEEVQEEERGYIERERAATSDGEGKEMGDIEHRDRCVDVVLSDMSAPWEITSGLWKNSLSNPYYRMMNTSGNRFKDHAGSMDLCRSALYFAYDTLKVGGHFVCKFYQGAEDKQFEKQLKAMFHKVHREKPESSRSESREGFFVGIKRLAKVDKNAVFDEGG